MSKRLGIGFLNITRMTRKQKFLGLYLALFALLVILDIYTKETIKRNLMDGYSIDLMPFLKLVLVHNRGAAFGLLADSRGWQLFLFIATAIVVSLAIVVRLLRSAGSQRWYEISLVLILAGAVGNLTDRVRTGYVIDFVQLYYEDWQFPAFNVADTAIFLGALMLIFEIMGVLPRRREE